MRVGDIVFVCPPADEGSRRAFLRGYLRRGLCSGGYAPLIKPVAALPGQTVEIGATVVIDGRQVVSSPIRMRDGQGRPIQAWFGGQVDPGTLFVLSSFAGSYDSRYFGPLPVEGLLGLARPVFTFAP